MRTSRDKDKSCFCFQVFLFSCVLKKVLCPINSEWVPCLSASFLQGPVVCLASRRVQEDCPHLAAPTTTPGIGFGARRHLFPPRHSGPKRQRLNEAAPPTVTTGTGRDETRRSAKMRRIKTGESKQNNALVFPHV